MSVTLNFDGSDLGIFKRVSFARAVSAWINEVGPEVEDAIKAEAPTRTGALKNSITRRKSFGFSGVAVEFGSRVPYAKYVEEGTPPHIIRARRTRYLRFQGRDGNTVYTPYVNHPGTRPNPFSSRAVERILPELQRRFEEEVESQFRRT